MALVLDRPFISEQDYRDAAMMRIAGFSDIALSPDAKVERCLGGAYVAAVIWVPAQDALPAPETGPDQKEAA